MKERFLDSYPDVMLPAEVQAVLGIGRNKTYELLKTQKIGAVKIGKQYRVPKKALYDYMGLCYDNNSINDVSVGAS